MAARCGSRGLAVDHQHLELRERQHGPVADHHANRHDGFTRFPRPERHGGAITPALNLRVSVSYSPFVRLFGDPHRCRAGIQTVCAANGAARLTISTFDAAPEAAGLKAISSSVLHGLSWTAAACFREIEENEVFWRTT
jgi:hypothetical protein